MMEIVDTLGFLVGTWQVRRSIEDHQSGIRGSFEGKATLTQPPFTCDLALGKRAHYDETGELHFGSHVGQARRSLEYLRLDDATAMLYFTNGRPFIDLDLSGGTWQSIHLCGDDRYEIAICARSSDVVEERWRVQGPTKDYDAVTTLIRVG